MLKNNNFDVKNIKSFRLGELFCGAGGIAWGAINAYIGSEDYNVVHAWANDYNEAACYTYIDNICPNKPETVICCDVKDLKIESLDPIDAFAFGFPCNDFSIIGKRKGFNGTYGELYKYGVKVLEIHKPLWFVAENVGGLKSANDGGAFPKILKDLEEVGYNLYPHLYKFEEYGVPQTRHRIIIVGIRKDLPYIYHIPSPDDYKNIDISCKNAINNPPIPDNEPNNEKPKQSETVTKRLSYIKPGQNAFTADIPEELRLKTQGAKFSQTYRRLHPDKPSYTVTGSGGGGSHIYHWEEPRALTNRERARLQTFPDEFIFQGTREEIRKQIGMAVPPMGAKIIFESILKTFAGKNYNNIPCNINI